MLILDYCEPGKSVTLWQFCDSTMNLEIAIEVFAHAFCKSKSTTYPYVPRKFEDVWILEDQPPRKNPRKSEVIVYQLEPDQAVEQAIASSVGWHFLCHASAGGQSDDIKKRYKSLGYRAISTEWIFFHDLFDIPIFESDPAVVRLDYQEEWEKVPQLAKQKRRLSSGQPLYTVHDSFRDYGWVESIQYGEYGWVAGLHVHEVSRRKGYGKALMSRLLQDEKKRGSSSNVLISSTAGAKLYPLLGYQEIGVLQIFCPVKR